MQPHQRKPAYLSTLRSLMRCTQAFERYSGAHVRELGLTPAQFDVIATLGNTEGMTCKELGERTLITKGTLTGVLDRLAARGMIERHVDRNDARCLHVSLTAEGEAWFRNVFPNHVQHVERAFAHLSDQEQNTLREHLTRLSDAFEEERHR